MRLCQPATRSSHTAALAVAAALVVLAPAHTTSAEPVSGRPRRELRWESIDPAAVRSEVNSRIIYLNRCADGGCVVAAGQTNSTADPVRSSLGHGVLSPFSRGDQTWSSMVACVKDVFAPFNVQITEVDPGAAPHFEILVAGTPQQLGLASGIGGLSPFSCTPYIPNSVVFVFDVWGDDVEELCSTAAQEIAHSFSIDHSIDPSDPMTYFPFEGRRYFKNAQVQCGSDCDANARSPLGVTCTGPMMQEHPCACSGGAQTQNSFQIISTLFGDDGGSPPKVRVASPSFGDRVEPGFPITLEVTDNDVVGAVDLRFDGALITTFSEAPYSFAGPAELTEGTHTIEATAYDRGGAPGYARVQVIVGEGCKLPTDCPGEADTCVGGRCVLGPGVLGGLGTSCTAQRDCRSWLCANSDGARYCVEPCKPGQCPDGFGCRGDGQGGGVCWPGYSEDTGGCASNGPASPYGAIVFGMGFAVIVLRRRRQR